jgi:hypothetical protein
MPGYPEHLPDTRPATLTVKITKGVAFSKCRALWIGTPGTLNFTTADGTVVTNFPAKEGLLPIAANSVQESGTADDIWALY